MEPLDDCTRRLAGPAHADLKEPFRLIATSVTPDGLFTVGVRADSLFSISDRTEAIGKLSLPNPQFERISSAPNPWENIQRLTALNRSASMKSRAGWVALTDNNGRAFVTSYPHRAISIVPLPAGEFAVGVGLAAEDPPGTAELTVFTSRGIYCACLPEDLAEESVIAPHQTLAVTGLRNGISLRPGDHVVYDDQNRVSRVHRGRVEILGKIPGEIQSISGYPKAQRLQLWAITRDGKVFRWSGSSARKFEKVPTQFPNGGTPSVVSVSGDWVRPDSAFADDWAEGFFTQTVSTRRGLHLERLLFLTPEGLLFSAWPNRRVRGTRPGRLLPVELAPVYASLAPQLHFEPELLLMLPSTPVSPVEVALKQALLEKTGLSFRMQNLLMTTWLQRIQRVRFLENEGSGIPRFLDRIGVPPDLASRLVFLDALPKPFTDSILKQRDLDPTLVEKLKATHRAMAQTSRAFAREYADGVGEARSITLNITQLLGSPAYMDEEKLIRQLESPDEGDHPVYASLIAIIEKMDPLWDATWTQLPD